jgi:hypothetical protein
MSLKDKLIAARKWLIEHNFASPPSPRLTPKSEFLLKLEAHHA